MPEVTDLVATLNVLVDPNRSDHLLRLISGARWRIVPADLMAFADGLRFLVGAPASRVKDGGTENRERPDGTEEIIRAEARAELNDAASLVEALDYLPHRDWVSGDGRGPEPQALGRLTKLRYELRYLRGFIDDDLEMLPRETDAPWALTWRSPPSPASESTRPAATSTRSPTSPRTTRVDRCASTWPGSSPGLRPLRKRKAGWRSSRPSPIRRRCNC